jgi:3-deoxy-D-manno-octulosonate 8-phosphate phosphatase (KDO 8-P phosphatase)
MEYSKEIIESIKNVRIVFTDCDGVLTDTGVYYSERGEELKRFSIRDGMGVERLRKLTGIETAIMTGENSMLLKRRAEKLKINEIHLGIKDKPARLKQFINDNGFSLEEIAYIGDDTNDIEVMKLAGVSACPSDATSFAKEVADIIVDSRGGFGAFRDFAEIIIEIKLKY